MILPEQTSILPEQTSRKPRYDIWGNRDIDWETQPKILSKLVNPFEDLTRCEEHGESGRLFNLEDELINIEDKSSRRAMMLVDEIALIKKYMTPKEMGKPIEAPEVAWIPNTVSPQDIRIAKACDRRAKAINQVID